MKPSAERERNEALAETQLHALGKDKEEHFQTAEQLLEAEETPRKREKVHTRPAQPHTHTPRAARTR